jgi:tRNA 2-selenouridine synthase
MSVQLVKVDEAVPSLSSYDAIIDVRSPAEFALDHLPGAVNWPVLDDEERRIVGTLYVQVSPHEARKVGGAMVARNVARHLDAFVRDKPKQWKPLVYCWRGGQRSGSMAWFLGQIGFRAAQLAGGYKGFRGVVRDELERLPERLNLRVLCGRTGSGKTRLLQALAGQGAQVLDLEALACHRGSVLGGLPDKPQPAQKAFDTALWSALRALDALRPVFVESESAKIGNLRVPDALLARMRDGECLRIEMPDDARVQLLLEEYGFFAQQPEAFCRLLDALTEMRGKETVRRWQGAARSGRWAEVFLELMREHYDPLYERSMLRNFRIEHARVVPLRNGGHDALQAAARSLSAD